MIKKSIQKNHPKISESTSVTGRLQLVTTDLVGPITPTALGGYKYMAKFPDHYSRLKVVYFIKAKSEALSPLVKFIQDVAIPLGLRVHRLRSDRGGEYILSTTSVVTARPSAFFRNSRHLLLLNKQGATSDLAEPF